MGVLQTPALLLGYGTKVAAKLGSEAGRKRKSISRGVPGGPQDTWAGDDRKGARTAYSWAGAASSADCASEGGCMVAFLRMATIRSSADASMETGVATVNV